MIYRRVCSAIRFLHSFILHDLVLVLLVLLRKVVGLVVKEEEQPWLREHGFLPPSQFALWPGTSVWDFLRVLHDYFWHRWGSGGEAWPVLDDVRHAFGSPDHVSRDSVHQVVGYGPELCLLHRSLVEDMRLDMGGTDDVDHAEGWFDAGSGQGCPLSPLDYAPMGEVRAKMVFKAYPGVLTPPGLLHSLAWADDTVWLGGSSEDVSAIARALPAAEDAVALGSDVSKMHVLRTWMEGQRVRYGVPSVLMNGVRLRVPSEPEYIRSLGRHALPHTYHKEDFRKFMTAARRASAVIPIKSLRAQYPPAMYNPKAGGMARFQAGVRPPPPPVRVWHLADLHAVSALRAVVGENLPAHRLLGSVQAGLSGILPLGPDVLTTFVLNYARQLNHPNPLTRASAQWGHMCALWRFSPDMPCVLRGLADCDCHPTDHDRFLRYTWLMEIRVWAVPGSHAVEVTKHPLGAASNADEASDAHAALAAGYRDWSSTRKAGWPSRFRGPESLP